MMGLTSLEVYFSIFNIFEQKENFNLHLFSESKYGGFFFRKVTGEIERDLEISEITATDLEDEK